MQMYVKRHIVELKIKALEIVPVMYVTSAVAKPEKNSVLNEIRN